MQLSKLLLADRLLTGSDNLKKDSFPSALLGEHKRRGSKVTPTSLTGK